MNLSIYDYFQREKELLEDALQQFSAQNTKTHNRLGLDRNYERDPHIERLLEGCCFLTARIRQQIELGLDGAFEAMLRKMAPDLLYPIPSMTLIEFYSPLHQLYEAEWLPEGIQLISEPVGEEQTACIFKTFAPTAILPLSLMDIKNSHCGDLESISIQFKIYEGVDLSSFNIDSLPLFINASYRQALKWHYHLMREVSHIELHLNDINCHVVKTIRLDAKVIRLKKWQNSRSKGQAAQSSELADLKQALLFQELMFFLDFDLSTVDFLTNQFTMNIFFKNIDKNLRCHSALFKTNIVPAINLFETSAEPIMTKPNKNEYHLKIHHEKPKSYQIYDLLLVEGIMRKNGDRFLLENLFTQAMNSTCHDTYYLKQEPQSQYTTKNLMVLQLCTIHETILSINASCSNGHYPQQELSKEQLKIDDRRVSAQIRGTNMTKPTPYCEAHIQHDKFTHYLSLFNLDIYELSDVNKLSEVLAVVDMNGQLETSIKAISSCAIYTKNQIRKGTFIETLFFELHLDLSERFDRYDAFYLGHILYPILKSFAKANFRVALDIKLKPTLTTLKWLD
tara:strand:- start:893 stop:2587 length:1695 start_codon:yes stop_codon:yes gene_type:complete